MDPRPITLILPYYENPTQLGEQYKALLAMPPEIRANLDLIVVDDGSPKSPATDRGFTDLRSGGFGFKLFRIDVDVRWNWLAARNIGAHHAATDWILLTDIDHMVPAETFRRIMFDELRDNCVYRFARVDAPKMTPYKPHPNSWLMTKAMFDKIGGYDERFSGYYGTDGEFRDRVTANCSAIIMLDQFPLIRVPRELVADASTTRYGRKEPVDHAGVTRIRKQIAREGGPTKRLSFPYRRII
jgi:hypothetical protein